jgi:hypothetical protein
MTNDTLILTGFGAALLIGTIALVLAGLPL